MPRISTKTTLSFVTELPLEINPAAEGVLLSRLEAARQVYNACLREAMRRIKLIRQSKDFNLARSLKRKNPERKVLFKRARVRYDFSEYALHSYSTQLRHSWLGEHIDSNTAQKLATRAYIAAEKVLFGLALKVRFKGKNQMDSVEGKSNKSGIRWKREAVVWGELQLKALITENDPVILHGLNSKVKYVRLVRRKVSGRNKFYAQLICEGKPFVKPKNVLGKGDTGLDIGPSTIAIVGDDQFQLKQFAAELDFDTKHIRRLQRKMDRSVSQLVTDWQSAELRLWAAWRTATECKASFWGEASPQNVAHKPATGRISPSSFGRCPEVEWVATEVQTKIPKSQDVVDANREPGKGYPAACGRAVGTPLL